MRRYLEALSDASSDSTSGSPQYRAAEARAPTARREGRPVTRRIIRALALGAGRSARPHRRHRWAVINNPDATSSESQERRVVTRWSTRMGPNAKSGGARGGLDRLISAVSPHQSPDRYPRRRLEGRRERRRAGEVAHPGYPMGSRDGRYGERGQSGGRRERTDRWEEEQEGRQAKTGKKRDESIEHQRWRQKSVGGLRRRRIGREERHERERTLREAVEQVESERQRGEQERGRTNDRGKEVEEPDRVRREKERQNAERTQRGRTMLVEKVGRTQQQLRSRSSDESGRMRLGRTEQRRPVDRGRWHDDGAAEERRQRGRPSRGSDDEEAGWEQPGGEQPSKNQRSRRDISEEREREAQDRSDKWANEGGRRGERTSPERKEKGEEEALYEEVEKEKVSEFQRRQRGGNMERGRPAPSIVVRLGHAGVRTMEAERGVRGIIADIYVLPTLFEVTSRGPRRVLSVSCLLSLSRVS